MNGKFNIFTLALHFCNARNVMRQNFKDCDPLPPPAPTALSPTLSVSQYALVTAAGAQVGAKYFCQ